MQRGKPYRVCLRVVGPPPGGHDSSEVTERVPSYTASVAGLVVRQSDPALTSLGRVQAESQPIGPTSTVRLVLIRRISGGTRVSGSDDKTSERLQPCARPIFQAPVHHQGPSVSSIRFPQMIPPGLRGQATLANVFVTHRWCQQQYVRRFGPHHLPDNPTRFLTQDGRVVPARQSSPAHHTG